MFDQVLYEDFEIKFMVVKYISQGVFNEVFKNVMRKMSDIGVLIGSVGEIWVNCYCFNVQLVDVVCCGYYCK